MVEVQRVGTVCALVLYDDIAIGYSDGMSQATTTAFLPNAYSGPAWDGARELLGRPVTAEPSLDYLRAEQSVRDFVARYAYTLDRGDVDALLEFFAPDCVMNNQRGTFSTPAEMRAEYEG